MLFFQLIAFGQENPWEPKKGKNPWESEEKKTEKPENKTPVIPEVKKVETTEIKNTEKKDTVFRVEINETVKRMPTSVEKFQIRQDAKDEYKATTDFIVGLSTGMIISFIGIIPSSIYVIPTSNKEKAAAERVKQDSTYKNIAPRVIKKKAANSIKGKKFGAAVGGAVAGSVLQIILIFSFTALF